MVCKVFVMYKCLLCIEIFQSFEEVLDYVGCKYDKRLRCEYCDYIFERLVDIKRYCECCYFLYVDVERFKLWIEEDCIIWCCIQFMLVFNFKKDKLVVIGLLCDKNNNIDSLMFVIFMDVVFFVD